MKASITIGQHKAYVTRRDDGSWGAEVVYDRGHTDVPLLIASLNGYGSEQEAADRARLVIATDLDRMIENLEKAMSEVGGCVWCRGTGCLRETQLICRTCGGTGRPPPVPEEQP